MAGRIAVHPILGEQNEGKKIVTFLYDGKEMQGYEGEPIAAALSERLHGTQVYHEAT